MTKLDDDLIKMLIFKFDYLIKKARVIWSPKLGINKKIYWLLEAEFFSRTPYLRPLMSNNRVFLFILPWFVSIIVKVLLLIAKNNHTRDTWNFVMTPWRISRVTKGLKSSWFGSNITFVIKWFFKYWHMLKCILSIFIHLCTHSA